MFLDRASRLLPEVPSDALVTRCVGPRSQAVWRVPGPLGWGLLAWRGAAISAWPRAWLGPEACRDSGTHV